MAGVKNPLGSIWVRLGAFALIVLGVAAIATKDQWDWLLEDDDAQTTGVEAPEIEEVDDATERLYRIGPDTGSSVSYAVEEKLVGKAGTAVGVTEVLAGDIVVNLDDPSLSRVGEIVINVEMFESGSKLRDKRIRHDFLESTHYPFASFSATDVEGIPEVVEDGTTSELTITGDLTIKEITAPATFTGSATLDGDTLTATMSGTVLMSTFDVGPIKISGLANTSDEVELAFDLVAERVALDSESLGDEQLAITPEVAAPGDGSFSESVQPILESRCVSCHTTDDGPGSNTWALDTAGEAAEIAEDIALVTGSGYMPPWPASEKSLQFEHDYSLDKDEIATIADWAVSGGGLDVDPDTKLEPGPDLFDPIERDDVTKPAQPYVGSLDRKDDYRCQVHEVQDPEGDGTWITGLAFEPDATEVVHHSIIYRVPASAAEEIAAKSAEDEKPGWTCFGLSNLSSDGVRSIGGWAPGQQPRVYPEGVGLYLQPGDMIVNQIHYHYDHSTPPDLSAVVLDTITEAEISASGKPMKSITGNTYLTPAEGPCTPEEKGPLCDRDAVLDDIAQKYDNFARFIPDGLIRQCGGTVDDYDDLDGTVFSSSCDLPARNFGTLYSVLGHMHEFGAAYRMTLNPDTPEERILLDIPTWSFEWQLYYVPTEEVRIEPGDMIRFECTWDRSLVHMPEPRYVTWNEGTVDEMCFSSVTVIPDD